MHFIPFRSTFQAGRFLPWLYFVVTNAITAQMSFVIKLKLIKYDKISFNFNDLQILGECVLLSGLRSPLSSLPVQL